MFNSSRAEYNLKYPSRSIAAVVGSLELDRHLFLAGTCSLKDDINEVHLLEFNDDSNNLSSVAVFHHPGEVWGIAPHAVDPSMFATVYGVGQQPSNLRMQASVWKFDASESFLERPPKEYSRDMLQELDKVGSLNLQHEEVQRSGVIQAVAWSPHEREQSSLVSTHQRGFHVWNTADNFDSPGSSYASEPSKPMGALCWDPHHTSVVTACAGPDVVCVDVRSMDKIHAIIDAHGGQKVRDVDHNPNKPYYVVTGGDDCKARFWDVRKADVPVKVLGGHAHWLTSVKYNRFHDQLVLSSSTDTAVGLWRVSSISSAPLLELEDEDDDLDGVNLEPDVLALEGSNKVGGNKNTEDSIIRSYKDLDDSVCESTWSACDAWVFASLSYSGQVVVNHVPSAEKYKILL